MYRDYGTNRRGGQPPRDGGYREGYLERTDAYYAGSRQGPVQKSFQNKSKSKSTKNYKKDKEENFRREKGAEVLSAYQADVRKSLLCGFDNIEEVIKAKHYEDTNRSLAIATTTRAVGLSVVTTYNRMTALEANRQRLPDLNIHQFFRVMLAMAEKVVFDNRTAANLDNREAWYNPIPFEQFKSVITSLNVCPQQIGALLRCSSSFKFEQVNFVPLYPAGAYDDQNRLVPAPESVCLTNLRDVVQSLSNPRVPVAVRRNFLNRNSIPGADFNQNAVLQNPDAIIPANYDADNLRNDLYAVKNWIESACDLKGVREKWFTQIRWTELMHGNESMLVGNATENLRLVFADGRTIIEGDVKDFWYRSPMSDQMVMMGTYHLGGELTSVARYMVPAFVMRLKDSNACATKRSHRDIVLALEN